MLLERHRRREDLSNYRAGLAPAAVYNVNRDPKKHTEPMRPLDFFRSESEQTRVASADEILQKLNRFGALARAFDRSNSTKG